MLWCDIGSSNVIINLLWGTTLKVPKFSQNEKKKRFSRSKHGDYLHM